MIDTCCIAEAKNTILFLRLRCSQHVKTRLVLDAMPSHHITSAVHNPAPTPPQRTANVPTPLSHSAASRPTHQRKV
jgi:hypothetical protein